MGTECRGLPALGPIAGKPVGSRMGVGWGPCSLLGICRPQRGFYTGPEWVLPPGAPKTLGVIFQAPVGPSSYPAPRETGCDQLTSEG